MIKLLLLAVVPFMTEHRNVAPRTVVSTNFYGSVTGIVDNAYIQAHGGGGVNTNAVLDIVRDEIIPATNRLDQTLSDAIDAHVADTNNPHAVTADEVGALPLVADVNGEKTAVTIGSREDSRDVGKGSLANGLNVSASGSFSHAEGTETTASGAYSHAEGGNTTASGYLSHAAGYMAQTRDVDAYSFAWNGDRTRSDQYSSNGPGTFNINPAGGLEGFYIGGQTLYTILENKADKSDISATNPTFSNAVLAVGLNIDTNSVAILNEIAGTFGGFPIEGAATTVGGLLAALAAAVAWLKRNKVQTLKLGDDGVATSAENGVAKLDEFFTESNSLLTGTIDDRLPIPISAKSAGFMTESYKRFIVTVGGDMAVILHAPTSEDAEIFECRFNGTSLASDASISFAGATATTMDVNCGTVKAGKVALMSAFWNGTTWDVNWKVEG